MLNQRSQTRYRFAVESNFGRTRGNTWPTSRADVADTGRDLSKIAPKLAERGPNLAEAGLALSSSRKAHQPIWSRSPGKCAASEVGGVSSCGSAQRVVFRCVVVRGVRVKRSRRTRILQLLRPPAWPTQCPGRGHNNGLLVSRPWCPGRCHSSRTATVPKVSNIQSFSPRVELDPKSVELAPKSA